MSSSSRENGPGVLVVAGAPGGRLSIWNTRLVVAVFAGVFILLVADLLGVVAPATDRLSPAEGAFALPLIALNLYWWGARQVLYLELMDAGAIRWQSAYRSGELRVDEITEIRNQPLLVSRVIEHEEGRLLAVWNLRRYDELCSELGRLNPSIRFR